MNRTAWIIIVVIVIAALLLAVWWRSGAAPIPQQDTDVPGTTAAMHASSTEAKSAAATGSPARAGGVPMTLVTTARYQCDDGKSLTASFYRGPDTPAAAGQPPVANGTVVLVLSDGRTLTLPQTISADGARYADAREQFIFWSTGETALTEGPSAAGYAHCKAVIEQ
ncbi:MAG TPA: MliC family protein [Candidatus Paceibacterota bacterium]|nr:MliC family protein [Candidatus Paceibacterota bacterium]